MLPFEDRYTRQRQVREVGLAGQERIQALTPELPTDATGAVALLYLQRAGVAELCTLPAPAFEHIALSPADLGAGCRLALQVLRSALNLPANPSPQDQR